MAKKKKWMQKAFPKKTKGLLHRKLDVPEDQTIPQDKLDAAYGKAKRGGDTTTLREINAARTAGGASRARARAVKRHGKEMVRGVMGH